MNVVLLREHIKEYRERLAAETESHRKDIEQRRERVAYYQSWSKDRLLSMTEEDLYDSYPASGRCLSGATSTTWWTSWSRTMG